MRTRRTPFYGLPEDAYILGKEPEPPAPEAESVSITINGADMDRKTGEIGTDVALGFMPHNAENRRQRLAGARNWEPGADAAPGTPTGRALREQRQKHRRGTLDVATRRLQRKRLNETR